MVIIQMEFNAKNAMINALNVFQVQVALNAKKIII